MLESLCVEELLHGVVVNVAQRHEVFLLLVLHHQRHEVVDLAGAAKEHLTLAVLHVFLDI